MIGKTLVHYEISAQIGRGGMGEVYQAKNQKSATSCLESGEDIWFFLSTIMIICTPKLEPEGT
jgi:serine/threonine protein kinase